MRCIRFPFLISSLVLLFWLKADPVRAKVDTLRMFPEKRFVNGVMDFGQYIAKNLRYPLEAMQAAIVGTELISITIKPTGKLANLTIINSLGKAIDRELRRVIQQTDKLWMPADPATPQDSIMLFLPIRFTLESRSEANAFYVEEVKPAFVLTMNEVILVGYGQGISVRSDQYHITQLNSAIQEKNYKQAFKQVSELIRRNPYNAKLYLQRANIAQSLDQLDQACRDYRMITNFLGNRHLPKQFTQNCP